MNIQTSQTQSKDGVTYMSGLTCDVEYISKQFIGLDVLISKGKIEYLGIHKDHRGNETPFRMSFSVGGLCKVDETYGHATGVIEAISEKHIQVTAEYVGTKVFTLMDFIHWNWNFDDKLIEA